MNSSMKSVILVTMLGCASAANAATFDYAFQDNVLDPEFSINHKDTISTERLSSPFATLTVSDEDGGVRFTYSSLGILDGKVSGISFNYLPAFQQGLEQVWPNAQPSRDGAYFFTDSDTAIPYLFVSGYGVEYSSEDITLIGSSPFVISTVKEGAKPASFVFDLDRTTSRSDAFTLHVRGLSSDVTAASLVPQYVRAVSTSFGKMPDGGGVFGQLPIVGQAVILASPVPEPSTTTQLLLGLLSIVLVTINRKNLRSRA